MNLIPAKDVTITIGGVALRIGDLAGFEEGNVVLKNGMKIKMEAFTCEALKKRLQEVMNCEDSRRATT